MKITTLLSVLLATSLAATVNAATKTSPLSTEPTAIPESVDPIFRSSQSNSRQQSPSPSNNDSSIFDALVNYDSNAADALIEIYNNAISVNNKARNTAFLSNAVAKKVAPSKDILPFCVAVAKNPTRTKIFRNKQVCDGKGWKTLFVFTAHTKKDPHHAAYPACVSYSKVPDMSMVWHARETCDVATWKTDFVFYMSGKMRANDPKVGPYHESSVQWITNNPDRVMIYPYYLGDKHGWTGHGPTSIAYRSRWRLSTAREMAYLKADIANHGQVHKGISMATPPNAATHRCVQDLVQVYEEQWIATKKPLTLWGKKSSRYVNEAKRDGCSNLVASSVVQVSRITKKGITSLELVINKRVYAAVSLPGDMASPPYYVRLALQESLRTGKPIPVAVDKKIPGQIVGLVAGTIATFGGRETFVGPIPNA
ncbi:hypothetical protein BGZ95_006066 [Linnemannia exigua]|uniref:Uncharacterized protein n=1 Tax=Linnemannia exigua TaxID=604196 RepID=A0AAD4H193_9FUNG|nr:hypothetical protein BGZ95_006066 [Linnemannia exigua]